MRHLMAFLFGLIVVLPGFAAIDDPLIRDPEGDVAMRGGVPSPAPDKDAFDLLRGDIHRVDDQVVFVLETADLQSLQTNPNVWRGWSFQFFFDIDPSTVTYSPSASYSQAEWSYSIWYYDDAGDYQEVAVAGGIDYSNSTVSVIVPRSFFPSGQVTLTSLKASTNAVGPDYVYSQGDTAFSDETYDLVDSAPDNETNQGTHAGGTSPFVSAPILLGALLIVIFGRRLDRA